MEHKSYALSLWIILLLTFGILLSAPAQAVGIGNDNPPGGGGNVSAESRANAMSYAAALTRVENQVNVNVPQAAPVATPQAAPLTINNNLPAAPAVTRQEIHQDAINVRSVPNVFAGNVYPTTSCAHGATIGASALGWGVSAGASYIDEECSLRETARSFSSMEMKQDALHVLCTSKFAAAAPSCKAIASAPSPAPQ
jgi:hypothetical protein